MSSPTKSAVASAAILILIASFMGESVAAASQRAINAALDLPKIQSRSVRQNRALLGSSGMRILVVEDEPRFADFVKRSLEAAGYAVTCCGRR